MKFKGKVAVWFWCILIGGNALTIYELFFSRDSVVELVGAFFIINIVFLPMIIRNYAEIDYDTLSIYFGFGKDSMKTNEISEIYKTHNPIASSAASLDRIVIKGKKKEMVCAVREKDKMLSELLKKNSKITIY
ncbi:PH domain-containing protein [Lachnotalea glycerini]|uniref:Uncharacterized protein YyaB-like PH domain-containing protein n=1 Tax=Lachnotalea glycerini TaxID=1763509 RepID=A0A371JIN7_9FIRM|nr:PH domain-containing protein [Lachnotalea glycerini]RDY32576.1 hypothetical protein CG710_003880 [Lachnotalea glycerini]